jgi:hypothetical protein
MKFSLSTAISCLQLDYNCNYDYIYPHRRHATPIGSSFLATARQNAPVARAQQRARPIECRRRT